MRRIHWKYWMGVAGAAACAIAAAPAGAEETMPSPPVDAAPVTGTPTPPAPATPPAVTAETLGRVSLDLEGVAAEDAARRLGSVLGSDVQIEGSSTRKVTLKLESVPVRDALERAAAAIGATWKRVYVFSKDLGLTTPAPVSTGLTVNLNLADTSCQAAAIIAAKAAGARMEAETELTGRVTLSGKEIPVEEAMERIAKAAGATWRTRYLFKLDATLPVPPPDETKPATTPTKPVEKNIPSYERDRYRVGPNGRRIFPRMPKERRTRFNTLGKYGAKMPPRQPVDVEKLEKMSRLGSFAGIFSEADEAKRAEQIQLFRKALETQSQRLDKYNPAQRRMATKLSRQQLALILQDTKALTEEQKKEVTPITDFLKQRIAELDRVLGKTK
jgi:hypothetical protein